MNTLQNRGAAGGAEAFGGAAGYGAGRSVRIYGTLGPACADEDTLAQMLRLGMTGVRLNLSHTTLDEASGLLAAYHRAAAACGLAPELLIDMQGPELRIGALKAPLELRAGTVIRTADLPLPAQVSDLLAEAPAGQELLLDDGKLLLSIEGPDRLRVVRGGLLQSRKSVALPGRAINSPALTQEDLRNLERARACGVTAVMQPFVRGPEDLSALRGALDRAGCGHIRILAKIENRDGVRRLGDILPCCDEIVIARGDLGSSMDLWELPAVQKRISAACRAAGRDFMVVTQMLDSMTRRPVPTRAEVNDIFNAVLDGAASVMVTGETASGDYPAETIRYLVNTVRTAEAFAATGEGR